MTMSSPKDKITRNTKAMRSFRLHRITAICIIVTLLLVDNISLAKETVIVREKSSSVADVPNSKFYPGSGAAVTPSFYRLLEFQDNQGNNSHMFVGGKNILLELRLDTLSLIREIVVPKYAVDFQCDNLLNSELYCHNYVTFLQEINEFQSVLCGTNYRTPKCVMFPTVSNNLTGGNTWHGAGMSASGPDQEAITLIKVEDGNMVIYSGAPTQVESDYAFSRTIMSVDTPTSPPTSVVKTNTDESTWIKTSSSMAPSFIGDPIEYNGKVYFFFREEAQEATNVNKVVYSRVGQVCADDPGGVEDGDGLFTTFLKARLSCATGGEFQMSFNYLRGIFRSPHHPNIIFGAFTTPESGFAASAVCAYDLAEIETLFTTSSFKGQKSGSSFWLNVPSNQIPETRPGQCSATQPFDSYNKFQLMSDLVPNKADYTAPSRTDLDAMETSPPLILLQLYRFQQLVIQERDVSGLAYDIFFLGTSQGQILKAYIYDGTPRIVDEVLLSVDSDIAEAINVMKIDSQGSRIFASTSSRVYSVPTENCQRFKTCAECVSGLDPACSWEPSGDQGCAASQDGIMDLENGNPVTCPVASSTTTIQTNPATPASETTDQTPSSPRMTTGTDGKTPNSKLQTGTYNSTESMGTYPPSPPNMTTTNSIRTTPPPPQPTTLQPTTEYNPFNSTFQEPNSGQQQVCPKSELHMCFPWILGSVFLLCCCNIPTCIAIFLSCRKRKKHYSPSAMKRDRDASQKVPLHSMERLNSELDEEVDELSPMTNTDNGSPHRHNENSLHEKKNGQSVALRIPSTGTPVRGTTVSASEA